MEFSGKIEGQVEEAGEGGGGVAGRETSKAVGHDGFVGLGADCTVAEAEDGRVDSALEWLASCYEVWSGFAAQVFEAAGYNEGGSFG